MLSDGFFSTANYVEAALWIAIGLTFVVFAVQRRSESFAPGLAAVVFVAFGFSDIVEVRTGAWWRPWWMLVWKVGCVAAMLALLIAQVRRRRKG